MENQNTPTAFTYAQAEQELRVNAPSRNELEVFIEYSRWTATKASPAPKWYPDINHPAWHMNHGALGLAGELLELQLPESYANIVEEKGDMLFYLGLITTYNNNNLFLRHLEPASLRFPRNATNPKDAVIHTVAGIVDLTKRINIYQQNDSSLKDHLTLQTYRLLALFNWTYRLDQEILLSGYDHEAQPNSFPAIQNEKIVRDLLKGDISHLTDIPNIITLMSRNQNKLNQRFEKGFTVEESIQRKDKHPSDSETSAE